MCAALAGGFPSNVNRPGLTSASVLLAAQSPGESHTLDVPFGKSNRLASPDGRYVLFGRKPGHEPNKGPELWFEDLQGGKRVRLLELGGTARAAWSPGGTWFYVNDHWASDSARSFLYDASNLERIDVREAILKADKEAARFANGHAYFEVDRWQGSQNVAVRFHGHTDEPPVVCFDLRYNVSRTGSVKKLAQHTAAVTPAGCN
jgi:hypothetical protein